jgi:glyoxylase-like metal-dependent hydrolase (beta-lactamase superfamily II)
MDAISIPPEDVGSLDDVAEGVAGFRTVFVNVYAIAHGDRWTLVDAGIYRSGAQILRWADEHMGGRQLQAIVLTHAHFDHVGALPQLIAERPVPVYIHAAELDYLRGVRAYPPPDPSVGGGIMSRMSFLYPRTPLTFTGDARPLPDDGVVPDLPDWQWIHTPGHSAGHVSLFRRVDRTLIVGDAFCTTKQESLLAVGTQRPELHGPPAYFTTDWDAARESVRSLAALEPAVIAPGHGLPIAGPDVLDALHELADHFDVVARPAQGKYVEHPIRG